jgi:hypothetical protein
LQIVIVWVTGIVREYSQFSLFSVIMGWIHSHYKRIRIHTVEQTPGQVVNPAQMADRLAIQDVLFNHSRGLDRLDAVLIQASYWPDAEVDYGSYRGSAHSFAELVVAALAAQYELTQHTLGNTVFAFGAADACTESHVTARHLLLGGEQEMVFSGRYLDRLEKRDGYWKLAHRQVVMDWSRRHAVADERDHEAFAALAKGGHREHDPAHDFLEISQ